MQLNKDLSIANNNHKNKEYITEFFQKIPKIASKTMQKYLGLSEDEEQVKTLVEAIERKIYLELF